MSKCEYLLMQGISKSYDGTQALRGVTFSADLGEVHALVGENGAGKSTLIKILSGAVRHDTGQILLEGKPVSLDSPLHAHRAGIRAVYQEFSLVPHLSVTENILLGQMPRRRFHWWVDWAAAHRQAQAILDELGFTGIDVRTPVSQLSVSYQQMVEIAKAVAGRPRILILDEPSAVLSQEELKRLFALMKQLKAASTLILYISHRLNEVFEVADRITVLKDGEIVGTVRPQDTDEGQLIRMMVGRTLGEFYPKREAKIGGEVLAVRGLSREGAFTDITFSLAHGEILGLFGLVGSGRTQVARSIFGAEPPDAGEIRLEGKLVRLRSPREALQAGIALLTEDRKRDGLVLSCSIRDNISLATLPQVTRWGFLDIGRMDARVQRQVQDLAIRPPQINRLVRQLSGGNQQKVALAKWLLTQAKVLILDEPTRGVDVATKVDIYRIMSDLADQGMGILLISSELPEILGMSDRVLVMREGRLVGEFSRAQASEERLLACAAGLLQ
ncbi:MAG: sugar ABC transporter ATP-binding protein [Anaerolineae bacterium]|nr:sugar ABC transporter ATP-binding protein [Anaerolineae bacterium]MDW8070516.1 sugar ABC transporter ATP-binding protein [Anaerolineae bacterium]